MTTKRCEAARLTDEEIRNTKIAWLDGESFQETQRRMLRITADAATAKALQVEDARHKALVEAAMSARAWFATFGYNSYGVAMSDDNSSHEPILHALKAALKQEEAHGTLP